MLLPLTLPAPAPVARLLLLLPLPRPALARLCLLARILLSWLLLVPLPRLQSLFKGGAIMGHVEWMSAIISGTQMFDDGMGRR
jgi:hypothetical protein